MTRLRIALVLLSVLAVVVGADSGCKRSRAQPAVVVEVAWPGARVDSVERELTTPIEDALAAVERSEHITSTSRAGLARVRVQLAPGTGSLEATQAVFARVQQLHARLPADAAPPVVRFENGAVRPAYRFVATSKDATIVQNTEVLRALGNQLERVPGVVRVEVERGALREWLVQIDAQRAQALDVTAIEVADAVRTAVNDAAGAIAAGAIDAGTIDAATLSQTPVRVRAPPDGVVIRVADVAQVEESTRPSSEAWPPNGSPPSLIVYVDASAPADIDDRIAGETMHARAVLGPGYDFQHAPITAREGVAIIVSGPEHGMVRDASRALHPVAAATTGVRDVDAVPTDEPELVVDIDRARAADLSVRAADVARAYALATVGDVTRQRAFDAPPVRVRTGAASRALDTNATVDALRLASVRAASGARVPLDHVVTLRAASGPERLERLDRRPAVWLCAGVEVDGAQDDVAAALRTSLAGAALPAGVSVEVQRGCAH